MLQMAASMKETNKLGQNSLSYSGETKLRAWSITNNARLTMPALAKQLPVSPISHISHFQSQL